MRNVVKLSERDLRKIVSKVLSEQQKKEMDPYISTPGRGDYLNRTAGSEGEMLGVEILTLGSETLGLGSTINSVISIAPGSIDTGAV